MADYTADLVDVGIDWITASSQTEARRKLLLELGLRALNEDENRKNKMIRWSMHGLTGWKTKHATCVFNPQLCVVELHGVTAHELWGPAYELAENVSRFDVQATVRQQPFNRTLAIDEWWNAYQRRDSEGKPPVYDGYFRRGAGNTLYIGSGASRFKARLYDKFAESREDGWRDCWRYEVQARRDRAMQVAQLVATSDTPGETMAGFVHSHFAGRGVAPLFGVGEPLKLAPLPQPRSDAEKTLGWIEQSWRPTLRRLEDWQAEKDAWRVLGFRFDPRTGKEL